MSGPTPPQFEDFGWRQRRYRRHRGAPGLVLGASIIAIGVLLLLDNLGIVPTQNLWDYWPVFLIVAGLARLTNSSSPSSLIWGAAVTAAGSLLLLDNLHLFRFPFHLLWPVIVIAFGASMLFRATESQRFAAQPLPAGASCGPSLSVWSVFSGVERRVDSQDFQSGYVSAIFGGVKLDLRQARIQAGRATVEVNAMFGGIEIIVPETWNVVVEAHSVFGGIEDKTRPPRPGEVNPPQVLVLTGGLVFGGVTIQN